jgi:signal transduction histidine kinase
VTPESQQSNDLPGTKYQISDLIDIDQFQVLMEKFSAATGAGTALLDLDGKVLVAAGWQDICTRFHRVHPETEKCCHESDTALANMLRQGDQYNVYRCMNGMVDVAFPVKIRGTHLANLFTGQFLSEAPDIHFFRQQARQYGFNEKEYLQALSKVPILADEEVRLRIDYLVELAVFLAEAGLNKMRLQELMHSLEARIEERTRDLKDSQIATLKMAQDAEEARQVAQKANEKLKGAMDELNRSNKELQQFAYVASHDLQEPLRMVASYTELLEERYKGKLDAKADKYIGYAVDGAKRMQGLINDLLGLSRVNTHGKSFDKIDGNEIVEKALWALSKAIEEKQAQIQVDRLPTIMGDDGQLIQLFQNLIGNAIKFHGAENPVVKVGAKKENAKWVFSVQDNGIGIDPMFFDRVFVIFQRLHGRDAYQGSGIGLAISKKIVERHGGKLWVESEPGKGSVFYFSLIAAE